MAEVGLYHDEKIRLSRGRHLNDLLDSVWDANTNSPSFLHSDFTFITKDLCKIRVHKIVFSAISEEFNRVVNGFLTNPDIPSLDTCHMSWELDDVDSEVFRYILCYIYTGDVGVPKRLCPDFWKCAKT